MKNIIGQHCGFEDLTIRQFEDTLSMDGMISGVLMPDAHPGKYGANGSVFLSENLYPVLAGNDIGCGYSLAMLDGKRNQDILGKTLSGFDITPFSHDHDIGKDMVSSAGTIGHGNHFLEIHVVDEILDDHAFRSMKLSEKAQYVFVHTGSRGMGNAVLDRILSSGVHAASGDVADEYMSMHDAALAFARNNRMICMEKAASMLDMDMVPVLDVFHNFIEKTDGGYLHRKSVSPASSPVMIAGSRGDHSALVIPVPVRDALHSIAHGAGRRINRGDARNMKPTFRNRMGNMVLCDDRNLLLEEDPKCYRPVRDVLRDLEDAGMVRVVALMKPLVTYKTMDGMISRERRARSRDRDMDRKMARKEKNRWK